MRLCTSTSTVRWAGALNGVLKPPDRRCWRLVTHSLLLPHRECLSGYLSLPCQNYERIVDSFRVFSWRRMRMWARSLLSLLFSALALVGLSHSSPVGDALECLSVVRTKSDARWTARCQSQIFPGTCEQPRCEYLSTASKSLSPTPLKDQSGVHALPIRGPTSTSLSTRAFPISNIAGQAITWLHT